MFEHTDGNIHIVLLSKSTPPSKSSIVCMPYVQALQ